ncbi:hypothetical protein D3C84_1217780 [compost metagenome]
MQQPALLQVHQAGERGNGEILLGEADLQHDEERHQEKQQQPEVRDRDHRTATGLEALEEALDIHVTAP